MCEGIVPLGNDRIGEAEGFCQIFVCHPIPSHGKFGKNEKRWRGTLIRNERNKLRRFKPVPRAFVVHIRNTNEGRLFTARKGTPRSIIQGMIAVGIAGIKLIGLPKGVQRVGKGYN